jgi:hypothetical protein
MPLGPQSIEAMFDPSKKKKKKKPKKDFGACPAAG